MGALQPPAERWVLWSLTAAPEFSDAALNRLVDRAVARLLERGEIRCRADWGLELNPR